MASSCETLCDDSIIFFNDFIVDHAPGMFMDTYVDAIHPIKEN